MKGNFYQNNLSKIRLNNKRRVNVMIKKAISISLIALVLSGCSNMGPNETAGTAIGAGGGALIGSAFGHGGGRLVGAGVGAVAGGLIGNSIGKSADQHQ